MVDDMIIWLMMVNDGQWWIMMVEKYLRGADWNMTGLFFDALGIVVPTDNWLTNMFQRGWYTTNQAYVAKSYQVKQSWVWKFSSYNSCMFGCEITQNGPKRIHFNG